MNRPTRQTAGGRAYLDLQNRARREKRTTQELLTLYVLERWLARLTISSHAQTFILKGGLLLAVFDARRPTADADLLARNLANDQEIVTALVRKIAQINHTEDDGVSYLTDTVAAQSIRDDTDYTGVRITMDCQISTATVKLKLDINVGDSVTPTPRLIELPSQRPDAPAIKLLGYPIETVLAEKISTAIALGEANTRVRDYADLHVLTGKHTMSFDTMRSALQATTAHRGVPIQPLSEVIGELATLRQDAYGAFRRRLGPDGIQLPGRFTRVVADTIRFVDPITHTERSITVWNSTIREWR